MLFYFIRCAVSLTLIFECGYSRYLCNQKGDTWEHATFNCNVANGKLLTEDNLRDIDLSELIKGNITEFWTSNVIEVGHAVEYKGCYMHSYGQSQDLVTPAHGINLVDCQSACNRNYHISPFYGLYDEKCICIYGNIHFTPSKNQSCFENCTIYDLESCRDSKLIALYKRIGKDSTVFRQANFPNEKCVVHINKTTDSTENCQKNLQYRCRGDKKRYILECHRRMWRGIRELGRNQEPTWEPVFFPALERIKNRLTRNKDQLKMRICKSLKLDGNRTYFKERNCTDSLPNICKTDDATWQLAMDHCNRAIGTLLTANNLKEFDLSEFIAANITEFWTANIIEVAHAVEYIGCYVYSASVSHKSLYPAQGGINLVDCQSACDSNYDIYPFYGLYGNNCICIYGNSVTFKSSDQNCFQTCSISSLESCQDSKLIALYRRIRNKSTELGNFNSANTRCVARFNSTIGSTENCHKILQYQCNHWIYNENHLVMTICTSVKVDGSHTYLKERNCTDSLPYICKRDDINATSRHLRPCHFLNKPTQTDGPRSSVMLTTLDTPSTTIVQYGPRNSFKLSPTNTTYTLIENTTFNTPIYCHADCRPECIYKWNSSTSSYPLIFGKVDRSQAGTYVCTATNPLGSFEVSITVIVQYGPRNSVKLSPTNTTYTLIENTTFNTPIYCHADCRPECTYKWNTSTSSYPLIFGKVDRSQAGTYVCTATNPIGSSEVSITVIVKCAPRVSSSSTVRVYVTIGQTLNINTSFIAYPSPDITWFCNGNLIEDKLINTTQTTEYKVISLVYISSTTVNDLGIYIAVAENSFGKTAVSFIVQEKLISAKATEMSLDGGVIVGSVFAGLVFGVIVTLLTIFLYRRKMTQKPKINKQTFSSPGSREQNESKYEDLQTRSETNVYDISGTEAQYENNTSSISNGPVQYEPLHDRTNISTYEELELNDKKSSTEKPLYANTIAK